MERDQIIKALECCIEGECDACKYDEQTACKEYLLNDALALLKELTEENERLRADTVRKIKTQVHNKAIYPSTKGDIAYISLKSFDSIIDGYISTGK